jgi:Double zinc ribbon/Adenylate and Guanylate cyclase catalytic domain
MRCPSCGFENASGIKFCGECGAPLKLKCSNCGFENASGIKFCGECGEPLAEAAKPAPPPDRRSYTPKHLAEKILQSKSALEGERKQVTVLFADVKGSMDLAEHLDPEDWHEILDRFFQILTDGVHRFEGTVNQYTGDGIMALFGAPIAHEDHAQRACYAAVDELAGDISRPSARHLPRAALRRFVHAELLESSENQGAIDESTFREKRVRRVRHHQPPGTTECL